MINTTLNILIVAGGSGSRMGSEIPKQFIELSGKPILMHTIEKFNQLPDTKIVLVLPEDQVIFWKRLCVFHNFRIMHQITKGGINRFYSVKNGLSVINGEGLVAVHDGVRPLVSTGTIENCIKEANRKGNAIPAIAVTDSVRIINEEGTNKILDRSCLRLIQTPQFFDLTLLKKAYEQEYSPIFTDDASVFECAGNEISLVEGNPENIKITTPFDLLLADKLISKLLSK